MPEEPLTEELLDKLLFSDSVEDYLDAYDVGSRTFADYLNLLMDEHDLKKADVIRESELNSTFAYELFNGTKKHPGRDKVLQLALGMHLSVIETQRLLKHAKVSELYPKDRRDAIILFCIGKGRSLAQTNSELYRFEQATITAP